VEKILLSSPTIQSTRCKQTHPHTESSLLSKSRGHMTSQHEDMTVSLSNGTPPMSLPGPIAKDPPAAIAPRNFSRRPITPAKTRQHPTSAYTTLSLPAKSRHHSTNPHSRKLLPAHHRAGRSPSPLARLEMTSSPSATHVEQPDQHEQMDYSNDTLPHALGSTPDETTGQQQAPTDQDAPHTQDQATPITWVAVARPVSPPPPPTLRDHC
jgi:hypothetical protein